jgi:hypothetical protein
MPREEARSNTTAKLKSSLIRFFRSAPLAAMRRSKSFLGLARLNAALAGVRGYIEDAFDAVTDPASVPSS